MEINHQTDTITPESGVLNIGLVSISASSGVIQTSGVDYVSLTGTQTLTNKTISGLNNTISNISLTSGVTGILPVANGGTNISSYAVGDIIYASGTTTLNKLASVAQGSYLRSGGVTTAPVWSTVTLPNTTTTGDIIYASASNVYSNLSGVATGNVLLSGGVTTAPSWGKVGLTIHVTGILPSSNGGTGVDNGSSTLTLSGNLVTTGAFNTTFATGFSGTITLPTATSTLATLALTETFTNKTLVSPRINAVLDLLGNEIITTVSTVSAVNEIQITNNATGLSPSLGVSGDDTNISLNLTSKGTGTVQSNGRGLLNWQSNYTISTTGQVTTTSTSYVQVNSMVVTPGAGTYLVFFYSSARVTGNSSQIYFQVFGNGTEVIPELRLGNGGNQFSNGNTLIPVSLVGVPVTVANGQTIEIRWRVSAGTGTMNNRQITLIRVG